MLIPNKYNGYQAGIRIYPVGGGVGEAMLLGAAMGGGAAAVTGGDPLKGALLGGVTGGIGGGLGGAAAGAEGAAAASTAGTAAGTTAGTQAGIAALPTATEQAAANIMSQQPIQQATQQALTNQGMLQSGLDLGGFNPAQMTPPAPATATGPSLFQSPGAYIKEHGFLAGASGLAGAMGARPDPFRPEEYNGPLKRFRISDNFRPAIYAEGGIATLASGGYDRMVGEEPQYPENMASGGISSLGGYSDGGRMLKGPGDGVSDSIPASIDGRRPARLADGEFVVPARIVSELGNGSTDAGARELYKMMNRVQDGRRKTIGRGKIAVDSKARNLLPG